MRYGEQVGEDVITCDAPNDRADLLHGDGNGGFCDDVAVVVAQQHLHGNTWILLLGICVIYNRPGDAVRQLVGMGWVYFFKHVRCLVRSALRPVSFSHRARIISQ